MDTEDLMPWAKAAVEQLVLRLGREVQFELARWRLVLEGDEGCE